MSSSTALIKRHNEEMALMPPPPTKRAKRPSTALDEDEYTDALSDIIARDYFPGLAEAKAQEEYLSALDSNNKPWIREAGQKLRDAMTPLPKPVRRTSRNAQFDTTRSWTDKTQLPDTPRGATGMGGETPTTIIGSEGGERVQSKAQVDTSNLTISAFQAKYTSEDNESFNTLLDKQNNTRRKKHAYLWTTDQLIPSQRVLTQRKEQINLLQERSDHEMLAAKHNEKALIPITTGATSSRPASVQAWQQKTPNNGLMFTPNGVEDTGLHTVMEAKEAASKAGPKETVFTNTRFPPLHFLDDQNNGPNTIPSSPSLDTQIIAKRDARRANKPNSSAPTEASFGGETPRVNGYAFVDEDEPENIPAPVEEQPTYRDLLAGQIGDAAPNPFKISEVRRREDLHLRLVAKEQAKRREKELQTVAMPVASGIGAQSGGGGNMTPAARKLMEKLGQTPIHAGVKEQRMSSKDMWTPGATPRRKR